MIRMPAPDEAVLARRSEIVDALRRIVPGEGVIDSEPERRAFECDGLTAYRQLPMVVVLPETTAQVSEILRYCHANRIKVVPRGAGTSLSGGALPLQDGILLGLGKFKRILDIDVENRCIVVQPGVTNLGISQAVQAQGLYYAPDPSSQIACTIGGNVAENSGGVHCLKYGLTTNNVIGVELVMMDGEIIRLGGKHFDASGYDLLGVLVGSEGMLGVVTEVTVRILPKPPGARALMIGFATIEGVGHCVAEVIATGIIPGGMEMMDHLAIEAAEAFVHAGYPLDAAALLIIELDGCAAEIDHLIAAVEAIAGRHGATSCRASQSEEERLLFWAGRKAAFPAVGRLSPDYYCMDGTIPRRQIGTVLQRMEEMEAKYKLRVANVFHAGDGNLHPLILYDANRPGELQRAEDFGNDILRLCVEVGGVLTGEHGVGVEKRDLMGTMFNDSDLAQQTRLKCAFDSESLLNPGKVFPQLCRCAELGRVHVHAGNLRFPDLPRF
ncbi:FAD/FMN-containing dehydrogenase [Gluconacetobacter liquefaciens NRIC 0522]|uniref:FAD-binding protein n=1 Tax=Gluconacetobacter liquefaciens TaxID=89584 RepID=A0A370FXH7_GLULI|nr:FAD-binding protein [Gluconacetobacter liquefaciens]RDI36165.1 glycolate oxidase [Gluconacetobacter liquefaciens]GBQ96926.1 FAD/FMN-containing dehydrogenase [Gluconacetobacter liquefaciens NRIC 0522]